MAKSKVTVGSSQKYVRFWLDGTPEEIYSKIKSTFTVYEDRPSRKGDAVKGTTAKKAESKKAYTGTTGATQKTPAPLTGKKAVAA